MSDRNPNKVRRTTEFDKEDYEWYIRTHNASDDMNKTGFSATISMLLKAYREICEEEKVDLKTLARRAAKHVQESET